MTIFQVLKEAKKTWTLSRSLWRQWLSEVSEYCCRCLMKSCAWTSNSPVEGNSFEFFRSLLLLCTKLKSRLRNTWLFQRHVPCTNVGLEKEHNTVQPFFSIWPLAGHFGLGIHLEISSSTNYYAGTASTVGLAVCSGQPESWSFISFKFMYWLLQS